MSKVMLVTGASRGIGAEIAKLAGRSGYKVGVNWHSSEDAARAVVDEICAAGTEAVALQADVGRSDEVRRMFAELDARFGAPDVLVNNAGVTASFRVEEADEERLETLLRANVYSVFFCAREAVRRMSTRHGGRGGAIVNISSVASRLGGRVGGSAYAASKGAVDIFTVALAKEVGAEGIRVNALRPGLIATEIHAVHGGLAAMEKLAQSAVPMARSGAPAEIAAAALWLASDAASYVHGAILDVSGGR
ncbi:MAG: SDR family oxidoreductase [Burkholderiaceae bacterium]|nr:SDR family oxidoreductase [Burkholderiaceae bacterium]